jgi:hypothetical protein
MEWGKGCVQEMFNVDCDIKLLNMVCLDNASSYLMKVKTQTKNDLVICSK